MDGANGADGANGVDGADGDAVDLPVAPTAVLGLFLERLWGMMVGLWGGCRVDREVDRGCGEVVDWVAARRARRRARLRARRSMVGRRNSNATISSVNSCGSVPSS